MIPQIIKDFIKSDKVLLKLEDPKKNERKKEYAFYLQKFPVSENLYLIYSFHRDLDNFDSTRLEPLFLTNKEGELLYLKEYGSELQEETCGLMPSSLRSRDAIYYDVVDEINTEVAKCVRELFDSITDFVDADIDDEILANERSVVLDCVKRGKAPEFGFEIKSPYNLYNRIIETFENKENLKCEMVKETFKCNLYAFVRYRARAIQYEKYLEEARSDNGRLKDKVLSIMTNDSYKKFKIFFEYPDGTEGEYAFDKKDLRRWQISSFESDIFNGGILNEEVPILSIKKIMWSRSTLLDASEYNINYSKEQQEKDFIEVGRVTNFEKERYADEEFVKKLMDKGYNVGILAKLQEPLKSNKEFIEFIKEKYRFNMQGTLFFTSDDIVNDLDFLKELFPDEEKFGTSLMPHTKEVLQRINDDNLKNLDFIDFLLEKEAPLNLILDRFDNKFVESKEFRNLFENRKLKECDNLRKVIDTYSLETIDDIFDTSFIAKNIEKFNYVMLPRDYLLKYVSRQDCPIDIFSTDNEFGVSIISLYKDDLYSLYELSKVLADENKIKVFLSEIGIDFIKQNDAILPFCSFNPGFVSLLDDANKVKFLESDLSEINLDSFTTHYSDLFVKGIYLKYKLSSYSFSGGVTAKISSPYLTTQFSTKQDVANFVFKKVSETASRISGKSPEYTDKEFSELVDDIEDAKEKAKELKETERDDEER